MSGKIQEIKADTSVLSQTSVKAELMEEPKTTSQKFKENQPVVKADTKVAEMDSVQNPENIDIPRIPISYVGFSNSWSLMQNEPEKRYLYLKVCICMYSKKKKKNFNWCFSFRKIRYEAPGIDG